MERMQASKMEYHFRISSLGTNGAPTAMCTRNELNHHNLEDSVPADMGDEIELVCFNSGVMAVFQRPPKRDVLHHIIANEEELFASTKPVFLNQVLSSSMCTQTNFRVKKSRKLVWGKL